MGTGGLKIKAKARRPWGITSDKYTRLNILAIREYPEASFMTAALLAKPYTRRYRDRILARDTLREGRRMYA
jgi:hypothetical protein